MICRYFLASTVILGAVAITTSAFAQSVNVPFSGNVGGACTFGTTTPGTLAVDPSYPQLIAGGYIAGSTMGKAQVTCNSSASLQVSPPTLVSGPTPDPSGTIKNVHISSNGTNLGVCSPQSCNPITLSLGTTNMDIYMDVNRPVSFPAGNYNYTVTLTLIP